MEAVVSVDLGGTNLRAAYFPSPQPPPAAVTKVPTHAHEGPEAVIARMITAIEDTLPEETPDFAIGVGSPGPLDPHRGVVIETPNLPDWSNVPLRDLLTDHFKRPVCIANDANLAALGESRFGAGVGAQNLIYMTISTGIGGGVIAEGKLLQGSDGLAPELGHMTVEPGGPQCGCGQMGHLEAVAAGPALARKAQRRIDEGAASSLSQIVAEGEQLTAKHVGTAARTGDPLARAVINEIGEIIGRHLASLVHAFNPEVIVLGGGVSRIGELFFLPIEATLKAHLMHPIFGQNLRIVPAELGDDAGLIGGMVLASELVD